MIFKRHTACKAVQGRVQALAGMQRRACGGAVADPQRGQGLHRQLAALRRETIQRVPVQAGVAAETLQHRVDRLLRQVAGCRRGAVRSGVQTR